MEVPGQGMQRVQVLPLRISVGFSGEFTDHKKELFIGTLFVTAWGILSVSCTTTSERGF